LLVQIAFSLEELEIVLSSWLSSSSSYSEEVLLRDFGESNKILETDSLQFVLVLLIVWGGRAGAVDIYSGLKALRSCGN